MEIRDYLKFVTLRAENLWDMAQTIANEILALNDFII